MRLILIVIICLVSGCARVAPELLPLPTSISPNSGWNSIKIRVHWPENQGPSWGVDPLLANEVFAPVIKQMSVPVIWRFHRRAMRDSAGHIFSFHYFAPPEAVQKIADIVAANGVLQALKERLILDEVWFDVGGRLYLTEAESGWSPELKAAWPYYIMGVSAAWLELVQQSLPKNTETRDGIQGLLAVYREVDREVSKTWAVSGQHAFLHHLSGVFGYAPIEIKREIQF